MAQVDYDGPIEIRTCMDIIGLLENQRKGMFRMNYEEHEHLVNNGGAYLFVLHREDFTQASYKLVKATEVEYRDNITWNNIFS